MLGLNILNIIENKLLRSPEPLTIKEDIKISKENIDFIFLPLLTWEKLHNRGVNVEKDNGCFTNVYLVLKKIFML